MAKWLRGAAVCAVLTTALTACGGGDDGGGYGEDIPGGTAQGGLKSAPLLSSTQQVSQAVPSPVSLGGNWRLTSTPKADSAEAAGACRKKSGTACTGVMARGHRKFIRDMEGRGAVFAEFEMYAFDNPENAKVASKALHTAVRGHASGDVTDVKVNSGADEADSFRHSYGTLTMMRVGGVVVEAEVRSSDKIDLTDELTKLARLQVERIKKVAAGKNPDA
ncbi:hypothetical protein AB0F13_00895 [Streptomyces sp. NPDC026206]|uniref:hypothetical protein n=1 Tax=Streptomyces sp. NPDC026206 TaxID=3157089 RepID=UPI0034021DE0